MGNWNRTWVNAVVTAAGVASVLTAATAQAIVFSATTTLSAQTAPNTSASPLFTDRYYNYITGAVGPTNGDQVPSNISKLPLRSLLSGGAANAKIYVETQSWFCHNPANESGGQMLDNKKCGSHIDIGYNSGDASVVNAQVQDMESRGIDGAVIDWGGQPSGGATNTQNNNAVDNYRIAAENSGGKFTFAVSEDEGVMACVKGWVPCSCVSGIGCNAESQAISDFNYILKRWAPSPAYMKDSSGKPIIYVFGLDDYATLDWTTIWNNLTSHPDIIFENAPGMTHPYTAGAYTWESPTKWSSYSLTSGDPFALNYLSWTYGQDIKALQSNPSLHMTGSVYKGFDDGVVNGWGGGPRYVDQQCGQTWLDSWKQTDTSFANQNLESVWLVTWDDYEEATEMETGISNCLNSLSPSISGSVVSWSPSFGSSFDGVKGSENTIADYRIYASLDGSNLMRVADVAPPTHSYDLSNANLDAGTYKIFVQAIGKPMLTNHMSSGNVTYVSKGSNSGGISGQITDVSTGSPIAGATVSIPSGSTSSDANGNYFLSASTGTYSVSVSANGYLPRTVAVSVESTAATENVAISTAGVMTGTVSSPSGSAVSGASISIQGGDLAYSKTFTADSSGAYNTSWIPVGSYSVTCSAPGYTSVTLTSPRLNAGQTLTVNCALTASLGSISGQVKDVSSGAAIANASVAYGSGTVTTDASGNFKIPNLSAGSYTLDVSANGYLPQQVNVSVTAGSSLSENISISTAGVIAGSVLDQSGAGISGASVAISGGDLSYSHSFSTSSSGAYNTSWIPVGTYSVTCSAPGYTTQRITTSALTAGATMTVNCQLANHGSVSGSVKSSSGAGIPGATVSYSGGSATTDANGNFSFTSVPAGSYSFTASASGYQSASDSVSVSIGAASVANFSLNVSTGTVAGQITDISSGSGVSGATVTINGASATTDSSGNYKIAKVVPGSYGVSVSAGGYLPRQANVTVAAGSTATENVAISTAGVIAGSVHNPSGAGVSGATIKLSGGDLNFSQSYTANSSGSINTSWIPVGVYTMTCSAPGYGSVSVTTSRLNAGATLDVTCTLKALSGSIQGRITDASSGSAVSGATVSYSGGSATTDSNGNYSFSNVPAGGYGLKVTHSGYLARSMSISVTSGNTASGNVAIATAGVIYGEVQSYSGPLWPGASVTIDGGVIHTHLSLTADSSAKFNSSWIPVGTYKVTCTIPYPATQSYTVTIKSGQQLYLDCKL